VYLNPLAPELNPSAQRCLPRFLLGILIFKGLTAGHLYKSFGVKGLIEQKNLKRKATYLKCYVSAVRNFLITAWEDL
jgi:hypothetical protein